MNRNFAFVLAGVLSLFVLMPVRAEGNERGRRNTAYLLGAVTAASITTGNGYAIGASSAATLYAVKRLGDDIRNRHREEGYYQDQDRCCPTCGRSYRLNYAGPVERYYDEGSRYLPSRQPQYIRYTDRSYDYEDDNLVPERASDSSWQNYSVNYSGGRPSVHFSRSESHHTSYSRRRTPERVIIVYR